MKLISLQIKNFMSYKKETILFNEKFCSIIIGKINGDFNSSVGAGKSTIFEAITWALFNRTRVQNNKVFINDDANFCEVIFSIATNKNDMTITRRLGKRSGHKLNVKINGKIIKERTIWEKQQRIEKFLGMDNNLFINSVLFKQGDIHLFSSYKPTKRIDVIANVYNTKVYDDYINKLEIELNEYESSLNIVNGEYSNIQEVLNELKYKNAECYNLKILSLKHKIWLLKEKQKKDDNKIRKYLKLKEKVNKIFIELTEKKNKQKILIQKRESIKENINNYANEKWKIKVKKICPFCQQKIINSKIDLMKNLKNKMYESKKKEKDIDKRINKFNIMIDKIRNTHINYKKILTRNAEKYEKILNNCLVNDVDNRMKLNLKLSNYRNDKKRFIKYSKKISKCKFHKVGIKKNIKMVNDLISISKEMKEKILINAIKTLEINTNKILSNLFDEPIRIKFNLKIKDKGRNTLDILIIKNNIARLYERFSGGERFKIDFALRLGLSFALCSSKGRKLGFLFIDEVQNIDGLSVKHIVDVIRDINKIIPQILFITHHNEVKDSFDDVIIIEKQNDISNIKRN